MSHPAPSITITYQGERLTLDAYAAMYWRRKRWLIVSDLHLGKGMHFRKHGVAVPIGLDGEDLRRLERLITRYSPLRVLLLGDLFHSDYNIGWEYFVQFTSRYRPGMFMLVQGNHDILHDLHYARCRMEVVDRICNDPFCFTHHPTLIADPLVNVHGHIHPAVRLMGKGRQSLKLPAFVLREGLIMMPSFGQFTGCVAIRPESNDRIYAIAEGEVHEVTSD